MKNKLKILVWLARQADVKLISRLLEQHGFSHAVCTEPESFFASQAELWGGLLLDEEILTASVFQNLKKMLARQPLWSDLPIVLVSRRVGRSAGAKLLHRYIPGLTIVERPISTMALLSVLQTALESRLRQHQVRDLLAELRNSKEALEKRLRQASVAENADVMLSYLDREFNFTWMNRAFAETCCMQPEEMKGRNYFDFFPDPESEAIFRQVRSTGKGVSFKDRPFVFPNQPERGLTYWNWGLTPVEKNGRVESLVYTLNETTEHVRLQHILEESEARERANALRFRQFYDFTPIPVLIAHDSDCRSITGNLAAAELFGVTPDTNLSQTPGPGVETPRVRFYEDGNELAPDELPLQQAVRKGEKLLKKEVTVMPPSGKSARLLGFATPLFDDAGRIQGGIAAYIDISERKLMEEKVLRSNEDLRHFASIVSHDLQEPLRTVSNLVQLLARRYDDKLDEKGLTYIQHIVEGTSHMQKLLIDLLAYSRVGGNELDLKPVSLEKVLKDVKRKLDSSIKENRAEITCSNLPVVCGDEMQLFTLLQNLISNGLKYRGSESPRIKVEGVQSGRNAWTVCVEDNGIGFEPEHAGTIFLIFQRLHLRNEYDGTGVGLAICKKIVERHGGRIWAESQPGAGARFCFTLPLEVEDRSQKTEK